MKDENMFLCTFSFSYEYGDIEIYVDAIPKKDGSFTLSGLSMILKDTLISISDDFVEIVIDDFTRRTKVAGMTDDVEKLITRCSKMEGLIYELREEVRKKDFEIWELEEKCRKLEKELNKRKVFDRAL